MFRCCCCKLSAILDVSRYHMFQSVFVLELRTPRYVQLHAVCPLPHSFFAVLCDIPWSWFCIFWRRLFALLSFRPVSSNEPYVILARKRTETCGVPETDGSSFFFLCCTIFPAGPRTPEAAPELAELSKHAICLGHLFHDRIIL